jgi:hypothetical protein
MVSCRPLLAGVEDLKAQGGLRLLMRAGCQAARLGQTFCATKQTTCGSEQHLHESYTKLGIISCAELGPTRPR